MVNDLISTQAYIKWPLSNIRFSCPYQQQKFEERLKDEQNLPQLISEIEDILHDDTLLITI